MGDISSDLAVTRPQSLTASAADTVTAVTAAGITTATTVTAVAAPIAASSAPVVPLCPEAHRLGPAGDIGPELGRLRAEMDAMVSNECSPVGHVALSGAGGQE